jgi:hypothetical protein
MTSCRTAEQRFATYLQCFENSQVRCVPKQLCAVFWATLHVNTLLIRRR